MKYVRELGIKAEVEIDTHEISTYKLGRKRETIPGAAPPLPRATFVQFRNREKKQELLRNKKKIKPILIKDNISIYEDITKARRVMLGVVKTKYRSAHTRNGDIAFYEGNKLTFVKTPNDLFAHGFSQEDITKCESALQNSD